MTAATEAGGSCSGGKKGDAEGWSGLRTLDGQDYDGGGQTRERWRLSDNTKISTNWG